MIEIGWPWVAAVAPLPLILRRLLPPAEVDPAIALRVPFFEPAARWSSGGGLFAGSWRRWLVVASWLLLVAAACRPHHLEAPFGVPVTGRDLLLAVDLSGSMKARDLSLRGERVTRLAVVKQVAGEFIARRRGDRVGLILFGSRAYLQTPLTFDLTTVKMLLDEAVIGLAGEQTAIGDAIGLSVKRLKDRPPSSRVLILLTDGANTAGEILPEQAARLAAVEGVRIYTIGIGAHVAVGAGQRARMNPAGGLDEAVLREVAAATGGRYFRAGDAAELDAVYRLLDELEPAAEDEQLLQRTRELYPWPLGAALALLLVLLAEAASRGHRLAWSRAPRRASSRWRASSVPGHRLHPPYPDPTPRPGGDD